MKNNNEFISKNDFQGTCVIKKLLQWIFINAILLMNGTDELASSKCLSVCVSDISKIKRGNTMFNKRLIATVTAAALLFGTIANCSAKGVDKASADSAKQASVSTLAKSNSTRFGGPVDLAIAREDKIIEMLKKEGKISKDASFDEAHKAYLDYMKGASDENENADDPKIVKEDDAKNMAKLKEASNAPKQNAEGDVRSGAKILVVMMEFPDMPHDKIDEGETENYYKDYNTQHYSDMMFGDNGVKGPSGEDFPSVRQYYLQQSGGTFKVDGAITKWYPAKNPYEYYGKEISKSKHDANPRALIQEALENVANDPSINLADFDMEDLDGNAKPDGIIDHFMVIHSGMGQEAGGGKAGTSAIWSHSSKVYSVVDGKAVPYQIPNSSMKAFHYTIEPEDGATGVFAHEFAHDLGYPDEYDTQYTGNGEPVSSWSIMAHGSWSGSVPGAQPSSFSPKARMVYQEKYGGKWANVVKEINYKDVTSAGMSLKLNQADASGDFVKVNLPDNNVTYSVPSSGSNLYFSGKHAEKEGNNYETSMTAKVDLTGKTNPVLSFKTRFDTEAECDYGYVLAREEGSDKWTALAGKYTKEGTTYPWGCCGTSEGWKDMKWLDESMDMKDFAGKKIELQFMYETDPYEFGAGWYIDDININCTEGNVFKDDAEGEPKFTFNEFAKNDGKTAYKNYYLVEWRNHHGTDKGLAYNSAAGGNLSYDPGMVVWFVDEAFSDNWVGIHPGQGVIGVVDASQDPVNWIWKDTKDILGAASGAWQMHDAAFGLKKSTPVAVEYNENGRIRVATDNKTAPVPYFDDGKSYMNSKTPCQGRILPKVGLKIYVTGEGAGRSSGTIKIKK